MSDLLHVVCPHCEAVNRIPGQRLEEAPKCGSCHRALFMGQPVELGTANFQQHTARGDIPLLVDFWAPWCGPCKMMAPQFTEAARRLEPRVRLARVNTETEQALGARFGIRSIPTLVLFRRGQEIARQAGAVGSADIVLWVQAHL